MGNFLPSFLRMASISRAVVFFGTPHSFFMLSLQFVLTFFSVISDSCGMLKAQKQRTHTHRKDARKGDYQYVRSIQQ